MRLTLLFIFLTTILSAQITISEENISDNLNWTADNEYLLDGYIFVPAGETLFIEAGTVVKGLSTPSTGDAASALIIPKGAKINAIGTATSPVIFTSQFDDLDDNEDLTKDDKGLWGGLIVLGNGIVGVDGNVQNVEGIPSTEGRAEYGGDNNADDSGALKYISIRHAGAKLEANNEINGLTLAGVGLGTEIDYVEVFANLDDGIEWFGGAVNVKHAVVSFCGDDSFDYDQSWDGNGQYWFSLQDAESNRAGEWDGSEAADLSPQVTPTIANATFIGGGPVSDNEDNNDALRIRDDGAAKVYNSVFTGFARSAIVLDNDADQDSYQRFVDGDIEFISNVFFDFGAGDTFAEIVTTDGGDDNALISHLVDNGSVIADPIMGGISREPNGGLDPRVAFGPALNGDVTVQGNDFFDAVTYKGAFDNDTNWALNWTALSDNGYFADLVSSTNDPLTVIDETISVYPNPAVDFTTVSFDVESTQSLTVQVIDMMGKVVSTTSTQTYGAGTQTQEINTADLQKGVYVVLVSGAQGALAKTMMVKK